MKFSILLVDSKDFTQIRSSSDLPPIYFVSCPIRDANLYDQDYVAAYCPKNTQIEFRKTYTINEFGQHIYREK